MSIEVESNNGAQGIFITLTYTRIEGERNITEEIVLDENEARNLLLHLIDALER